MAGNKSGLAWLFMGLLALGCSSDESDTVEQGANATGGSASGGEGADPPGVCSGDESTPICTSSSSNQEQRIAACQSSITSGWGDDTTGTVVATGTQATPCVFQSEPSGCEPSFIELYTPRGRMIYGVCVPGGFQAPPLGSVVSVQIDGGGEFCSSLAITVREGTGALLMHAVSGQRLALPELGIIEPIPVCHTLYDWGYTRQLELAFTLGDEVARGGSGDDVLIGGYGVSIYAAETHFTCPDVASECGDADERDVALVVPVP